MQRVLSKLMLGMAIATAQFGAATLQAQDNKRPNIVIIWGDDIGRSNDCLAHTQVGFGGHRLVAAHRHTVGVVVITNPISL